MNIVTITLNPAIDQTITLDRLIPGQVHRVSAVRYNAGGKGVNVSSCLADWGLSSQATGILGRGNASIFEDLCRDKGIGDRFIRVDGLSRTNIKIVDDEDTTDINLPGVPITEANLAAIESRIVAEKPDLTVLAGSLPLGCPVSFYRDLTARIKAAGGRVIVDADGEALAEVLAAPVRPYAVKPNRHELSRWAGRELSRDEIVTQALALRKNGLELVIVSLGKEGAIFAGEGGVFLASGSPESIVSTVGAGDAMVAGISAALIEGAGLERLARLSTAFSLAKLAHPGPNLPARKEVESMTGKILLEKITHL
jgi:1-phosphofructokinase